MTDNLPAKNADGFVALSDFYAHHHQPIETALKTAQIPHQIKFHPPNAEQIWEDGAFRVYVPAEYVESGRTLYRNRRCCSFLIA
ncbi:hypothetical protein QUA54_18505 [Microcoleus sp. MOSTC5]|uniref:hypothetical protein n=1 Tax=Microcoleus sp. MOSTC5 TaxID=3055378 RepID=UPI002FD1114D